jgi:hypothetical protein
VCRYTTAVSHTKMRQFLDYFMAEELAPTLRANPGMGGNEVLLNNIPKYSHEILTRFENVAVKDQLDRLVGGGSSFVSCVHSIQHTTLLTVVLFSSFPNNFFFTTYIVRFSLFFFSK